ncbi:MAG: hypothetical protein KBC84_08225 [Proteobacteria bacterium]|nr:hypothetical protein [Pseudomonadota bacterium]
MGHHRHQQPRQNQVVTQLPHAHAHVQTYGQTLHCPPVTQHQEQVTSEKYSAGVEFQNKLNERFSRKADSFVTKTSYEGDAMEYKHETLIQTDQCGRAYNKYIFVNKDGAVKEFRANGQLKNGYADGEWVERKDIQQFFLSGDKVYDDKGKIVGELALDPHSNKNLIEKHDNIVKGNGVFKSANGQISCFNGNCLTLNGRPAIVRVGLPPDVEMEATYEKTTTNTVVVDSAQCPSGTRYANGGIAYQRTYKVRDSTADFSTEKNAYGRDITAALEAKKPVALDIGKGIKQEFHVVKTEGDYIYLSESSSGQSTIRLKKDSDFSGSFYTVERLSRAKAPFYSDYSFTNLAYANIGWVAGESIYSKPAATDTASF